MTWNRTGLSSLLWVTTWEEGVRPEFHLVTSAGHHWVLHGETQRADLRTSRVQHWLWSPLPARVPGNLGMKDLRHLAQDRQVSLLSLDPLLSLQCGSASHDMVCLHKGWCTHTQSSTKRSEQREELPSTFPHQAQPHHCITYRASWQGGEHQQLWSLWSPG